MHQPGSFPVRLKLESRQQSGDEPPETIRRSLNARAERIPDGVLLRYHESEEDGFAGVVTEVSITPASVVLRRRGGQVMKMHFRAGVPDTLNYDTPYGSFPLRIETREIRAERPVLQAGSCFLRYDLTFEGQSMQRCQLSMEWSAAGKA